MPRAAISWSGGKDSCAALHRAHPLFDVVAMVTMFDENAARSRSHGLRPDVVAAQAERLGLRQVIGRSTRFAPMASHTSFSATSCSRNIASGRKTCARRAASSR